MMDSSPTRINLLPPERQHAYRQDYVLRLGSVIFMLWTSLVAVAALLLFPMFVFLTGNAHTKEARLAMLDAALSVSDEKLLTAQLDALSSDTKTLLALSSAPSVTETLRTVLAIKHPGVMLSALTYTPASGAKRVRTISISGIAATRDALRSYQLALAEAPLIASTDLPVSVYAKETDIAFTIAVALNASEQKPTP